MGIQGLLPFLKKIHTPVNVSQFEGCTVAIDAYCWLHKGAFSCAEKLALGEKTDQYVYYCMKYLEYMLRKNIKPIMVFDGCHLPSKKDVEKSRREKRDMNRKKAALLLREGKRAEARECLQRCIDISPEMALDLMNTCRARGIDCIVAPYEADAQLAYLNKCGIAQVIITEDSDLLLFGCERVIFKMDHFGNGVMIERARLNEVLDINSGVYTFERFRHMCILSGCDYLPSLSGIGLVKACKVFKMARQTDLRQLLKKFPSMYLKMSLVVPEEYIEGFVRADNTFLYQLVYDPQKRALVPLNDYPVDRSRVDLKYAGPNIEKEKALQIALGNINIYTGEKFANFDPETYVPPKASKKQPECLHHLSIWSRYYRIRPNLELKESQNIPRPNLKGKECSVKFPKKSSIKRIRPAEDGKDTKSDFELSGLYASEAVDPVTPTKSPKRKKYKADSDSDSDSDSSESKSSILKRFSFSSRDVELEEEEETKPDLSSGKPRFIASLKEAEHEVPSSSKDSLSLLETSKEEKENLVSPRKNKFAILSANKKPRFDINASKEVEVKSRFFLSSPPTVKNEEQKSPCKIQTAEDLVNTSSPTTQSSSPQNSSPSLKLSGSSKKNSPKTKSKVSPSGSAFSWSKFKFTRQDKSQQSVSPANSQFKKVITDSNSKSYFQKDRDDDDSETNSQNTNESEKDSVNNDARTGLYRSKSNVKMSDVNSQSSVADSYCSIDSFCLMSSQDSDIASSVESVTKEDNSGKECTVKEGINSSAENSPKLVQPKSNSIQSFKSGKSGCRVSGLTKGKGAKSKNKLPDKQQRSVKDMLSKFAHTKKSMPNVQESTSTIEEDDSDIEITGMTPSQDRNVYKTLEKAQRKLLS